MSSVKRLCIIIAAALAILTTLFTIVTRGNFSGSNGHIRNKAALDALKTWSFSARPKVVMHVDNSTHYVIDDEEGAAEFAKLLPSGGHTVHVGQDVPSTYTVTMFHQLRCLDILRQQYLIEPSQSSSTLPEHCMNYLRQTFWCHPNLRLESMRYSPYIENHSPAGATTQGYDTLCNDWRALYEEAEKNYEAFESLAL